MQVFFLSMIAFISSLFNHQIVKRVSTLPTDTLIPTVSPTPNPTQKPSPTPTLFINPYQVELKTRLESRLNDIDTLIAKWNEAISYDQQAEKDVQESAFKALQGDNGVHASSAELFEPVTEFIAAYNQKIMTANDEIDKLNEEKTRILIELSKM